MSIISVERATIQLGDMSLEVFETETPGEYRLSQSQVLETIGASKSWFSGVGNDSPRVLEWLRSKGFRGSGIEAKIKNEVKARRVKLITISDAVLVWLHFASNGNDLAKNLLAACAAEAIERRADKAFDNTRAEEEYNARLAARLKGKQTRRTLTDAIHDWYVANKGDRPEHIIYAIVTNKIYSALWGMTAEDIESHLSCKRHKSRCFMSAESLHVLEIAEANVRDCIDYDGMNPISAADYARIRRQRRLPDKLEVNVG